MESDFNPTERNKERARRLKVQEALKTLEEADYLLEEEWNQLNNIREKSLVRDFILWMKERGFTKKNV